MTKTTTFTKTDQLDADGKKVDDIFTIKEVETVEYEKEQTLSGTEVAQKIKDLEDLKKNKSNDLLKIEEEINFLKSLK